MKNTKILLFILPVLQRKMGLSKDLVCILIIRGMYVAGVINHRDFGVLLKYIKK